MKNLKKFTVHSPTLPVVVGVYYEQEDFLERLRSEIPGELDTNEEAALREFSTPESVMSYFQQYEDTAQNLCDCLTTLASHYKEKKMLFLSQDDLRIALVNSLGTLISIQNEEEKNESGNSTDKTPEDTTSVSD